MQVIYDEGGHVLVIKGICNHPAPSGNNILNMGGNSTWDWLRKTLRFWRDGSKWPSDRSQGVQRSTFNFYQRTLKVLLVSLSVIIRPGPPDHSATATIVDAIKNSEAHGVRVRGFGAHTRNRNASRAHRRYIGNTSDIKRPVEDRTNETVSSLAIPGG